MAQGEKDTLFSTIWKIADDLRGSVDGWDFKMYVLGFLFYKFLSENLSDYVNKMQQGGAIAIMTIQKKVMKMHF